ncbi:MAG: VWA domain-containing protein [Bryobacteraceae bacterium]
MRVFRPILAVFLPLILIAQERSREPQADFRTTVSVVTAPVTVLDSDGNYVSDLQPHDFRLFDNRKEQNIKVDVHFQPISLVIAVQASAAVEEVLPQVRKIGSLIEPMVVGERGEASVVAFDGRVRVLQEFTADFDKISAALKKLTPGSGSSRLIDGVTQGIRMLRSRPTDHRRVLLLISETRDRSSEGRVREALIDAQLANVTVYTVNVSRFLTTLTAKPGWPRPDPQLPAARPMPPGVAPTPHTAGQVATKEGQSAANFVPLMVELYKDVKAIFIDNPVEVFTRGTGGREYSFMRQKALEEAISNIGEELHSQYLLTYTPNNKEEGGFHEIKVTVARRVGEVRTRPGYWVASSF